jgi:hypothetical protein
MTTNQKKNIWCSLTAIAFLFIAAGSANINKIHCGAFNSYPTGENKTEKNYILLNDGSKVTGEKISWKSGLLVKDQIRVDDQKFKIKETRGYFSNGTFYGRIGSGYAQRIVHGKLNVYYTEEMVTTTSTSSNGAMRTNTHMVCIHYVQVGDDGDLKAIAGQSDIKEYVKDCPKSMEMISKKNKEIRRAIRKNSMYLNDVFIIYNNNCQEK